jgi:hypothetical protein
MSRHTIPALQPGITVVVGWDNPLSTFFAQVSHNDAEEDDDPIVLWLGTTPNEVLLPQDLVAPLAPYAVVTDHTIARLRADRAACLDRAPSGLQRTLLSAVRRTR